MPASSSPPSSPTRPARASPPSSPPPPPRPARFWKRAVPVPEGSGSLAEIRERLFRVAQTHGIDATRVAVAHAAALLAAAVPSSPGGPRESGTNDSRSSQQKIALEAARDATRDLERRFAADPEGARAGLVREAWPVLSGRAFKPNDTSSDGSNTTQSAPCASGDAFAAYFAWIRACRLSSSASCFREARDFAARGDAEAEAREEAEAKLHARRADAADAAATTAKALAAMVRRAAGSYRLGAVRVEAFLGAEAHDAPPGGARGFVAALAEALAPAAAAAPASSAAAAAAVAAAGALARAVSTAPALPAPLAELPAPASAAAVAAATATLRPDRGPGSKKIRAAHERWAAAAAHLRGMLPADVFAFARHAAFETAPHPFERLFSSPLSSPFKGEENETRPKRFGASFASEAALSARLAALADAEKRLAALAAEVSSSKRENVSALLESTRASLARLSLVAAARGRAACARRRRAGGARSRRRFLGNRDGQPRVVRRLLLLRDERRRASIRGARRVRACHVRLRGEHTRRARAARVVFRRRPRARHRRARRDGGARRRRRRRNARAVDAGAFSDAARRVRLAARGVSASARGDGELSTLSTLSSDAADAARAAVFEAIRAFATSSRTPPSARATALEILSENCSAHTQRRGDSNGGENARENTRGVERRARPSDAADADADDGQDRETQIINGSSGLSEPEPESQSSFDAGFVADDVVALLAARTSAAAAAVVPDPATSEADAASVASPENARAWFERLLSNVFAPPLSRTFGDKEDGTQTTTQTLAALVAVPALWDRAAPWRATPEGRDAVSRCRVELMVAAFARGAKTFEAREDALATLASFLGDDAFFFTPTRTCLVADGWDEADGWDDADGWGDDASASHPSRDAEETLFPKRFSEEKQKRVPEVTSSAGKETSFPFRPEDAARVVAAAFAGGTDDDDEAAYEQTVFAAKVALLFPFPDLHEETLARLAAIRETERATERSAFSHKKRNLLSLRDPDPAFAALAAARLPSLLSSDSRAGPSTPRAKSARDLAVETVLARRMAQRRRARDEGVRVSRDDDALAAFAASAFAAARR